jgi:hypothetical protein
MAPAARQIWRMRLRLEFALMLSFWLITFGATVWWLLS